MTPTTARRVLRGVLVGLGALAAGTGTAVAVRGTDAIPGGAATVPSNDSVLRFYAVWWAAQGPLLWKLAADLDRTTLRAVSAITMLGGVARIASARRTGRPHPLFVALTAAELAGPPLLLWLRHRMDGDLDRP